MQKLIVALSAVLITGLAGFSINGGDAQDSREVRPRQVRVVEVKDAPAEIELEAAELAQLAEEDYLIQRLQQEQRGSQLRVANMRQEAGTWQIVTLDKMALLLNTATGDTFMLEKGEEGLHWKSIGRPMGHDMPDMQNFRPDREQPNLKDIEERLEGLRKQLKEAEGDARERLKNAIEELEQARKRAAEGRDKKDIEPRDKPDREDAKREGDDMQNQLREVEEKIADLKQRFEDSDSVKEREKIEKTIRELKEKAEGLRKDRKDR